jgi:uncharacterized protein YndB with AHSA1/START domain
VPTVRRSRTIASSPEALWKIISDPHHLPRWWPGVKRVEGVEHDRFTQVLYTKKGRPVRIDFRRLESEAPRLESWSQEVEGTPFARVLAESVIEVQIEPEGEGSAVTIEQRQQLKGYSRTGGLMLRRATRTRLDEALDGLEQIGGR